ncbi:MAG: hypothetical protein H7222_13995 [Methylotenera sp.]|nr:hypothetical protein [Oligoflexia bacterium]
MDQSPHIIFRDFYPSLDERAMTERKANKLVSYYHRVVGCQVMVEAPHRHHQRGNLFRVRITLDVPGEQLVVGGDPHNQITHRILTTSLSDAFHAAQRVLHDYVERKRHSYRKHSVEPAAIELPLTGALGDAPGGPWTAEDAA